MRDDTITIRLPNGQLHRISRRVYEYHIRRVTNLMSPTVMVLSVRGALREIGQEWRNHAA